MNARKSWSGGAAPAAIDANGASFSTNLGSERSAMLRNSIPGTLLAPRYRIGHTDLIDPIDRVAMIKP